MAVEVLAKAYQESPEEYEVARTYGWYLRKNGQLEEAEEKLLEALRLNSGDIESKGMLGGLYKRQRRYDESYKQYLDAISIDPNSVYHLVNLGALEALAHPDTPDKSKPWYSRVIELCEPDSASSEMPLWDRALSSRRLISLPASRIRQGRSTRESSRKGRTCPCFSPRQTSWRFSVGQDSRRKLVLRS
jgi:tetratricopeptide (TPR) repeat protein